MVWQGSGTTMASKMAHIFHARMYAQKQRKAAMEHVKPGPPLQHDIWPYHLPELLIIELIVKSKGNSKREPQGNWLTKIFEASPLDSFFQILVCAMSYQLVAKIDK